VRALTARFRKSAQRAGLPLLDSNTPIQPIVVGSSAAAVQMQQDLYAGGFRVIAIRAPTVPQGSERLRVTLSAAHTEEQVDALVERLQSVSTHTVGLLNE
jgi:8-amino-7-oxononanoate synthase